MRKTHLRKSYPGTSLPENSLVLGLVILACVIPLTLAGDTIKKTYLSFTSEFSKVFQSEPSEDKDSDGETAQNSDAPEAAAPPQPGQKNLKLTLADGTVLNLKGFSDDVAENVETVGVDGTSRLLAKNLETLAEQLKAAGKLDQDQYNALIDLALEGYHAADRQTALAKAMADSQGDAGKYKELLLAAGFKSVQQISPVEKGLQAVRVEDFGWDVNQFPSASMIQQQENGEISAAKVSSWAGYSYNETDPHQLQLLRAAFEATSNAPPSHQNSLTERMLQLYLIASQTKALQDPSVKFLVTSATKDLVYLTNASASSYNPQEITAHARTSRKDASVICTAGNGSVQSGIDCQ